MKRYSRVERSRLLVLWLGVGFLLAQSVALATLPDPTWIPGIYAYGDFDDQTAALVAIPAVVDAELVPTSRVVRRVVALVPATDEGVCVSVTAPASDPRGPPLA